MPLSANQDFFLQLVRIGIGNDNPERVVVHNPIDWNGLEALAVEQGLSAVLVDGVEKLPEGQKPPKPVLLQWIGEALQGYEYRYELYCRTIAEMAAFYNTHAFRMMVMKGYACSLDWPKSEHRPCGDIDIWLFGKQKESDALLTREKGITIDQSHLHHTVFYWRDFMVENHYEIVDTMSSRSNAKIEKLLEELAMNDKHAVEVYGEKVWIPSPDFHALFLLRHAILHFTVDEMNIRHALDWGFFVKQNGSKINWDWLLSILDEFKMREFFDCLNAICIEDLGFDPALFPHVSAEIASKDKVIVDLLSPAIQNEEPKQLVRRIIFKYHRRKERKWKHDLCYNDPMWSHLLSSLWLHIRHPEMI